jgi:hypothetical protein
MRPFNGGCASAWLETTIDRRCGDPERHLKRLGEGANLLAP